LPQHGEYDPHRKKRHGDSHALKHGAWMVELASLAAALLITQAVASVLVGLIWIAPTR